MKNSIFILSIIAFNLYQFLSAQTINIIDKQGYKQGLWKNYVVDTVNLGCMEIVRPDSVFRKQSIKHCYSVRFILISEGYYVDNKKEKVWKFYDKSDTYNCTYKSSKEKYKGDSAKFETSYCLGKIIKEVFYRNDTIEGIYKSYYGNRNIKSITHFNNGNISDSISCFYENGNILFSGNLIKGTEYFQVVEYYESGGQRGIKKLSDNYIRNEWINK